MQVPQPQELLLLSPETSLAEGSRQPKVIPSREKPASNDRSVQRGKGWAWLSLGGLGRASRARGSPGGRSVRALQKLRLRPALPAAPSTSLSPAGATPESSPRSASCAQGPNLGRKLRITVQVPPFVITLDPSHPRGEEDVVMSWIVSGRFCCGNKQSRYLHCSEPGTSLLVLGDGTVARPHRPSRLLLPEPSMQVWPPSRTRCPRGRGSGRHWRAEQTGGARACPLGQHGPQAEPEVKGKAQCSVGRVGGAR